jgi:hypothetical protein
MDKPVSPVAGSALRQRFVEDMTMRGFSEKTRRYYIRIIAGFAAFLARSPDAYRRPKLFTGAELRFSKQRSRKAAVRTGSIGPTYFFPFRTFRSGRVSPRAAIPTGSMAGFVLVQDTRPSTALLAFDIGPKSSAGQYAAACGEPIRPGGHHRRSPESGRSQRSVASGRDSPRQPPARRRHVPQVGVDLRKHRATPAPPPASHAKAAF